MSRSSGEKEKAARNLKYYVAALISFITFLVYVRTLRNGFLDWDDGRYVFENPHILSLDMTFFKWAFFDFYEANWHPLTWISHALDYALWGLNPLGHHLTNNILHAVNTFLVVVLVVKLLTSGQADKRAGSQASRFTLLAAATTGLLFGLHPLHVESVAWVAERKDLLCGLFFLLSIMAYTTYAPSPQSPSLKGVDITPPSPSYLKMGWQSRRRYLLSLGFFTLALLSKPMAVSLPVVLLILDWNPLNRIQSLKSFGGAFIEKLPFFALSIASSVLTIMAQRGAIHSLEVIPMSSRLPLAAKSIIAYLGKMVLPINLVPFYPYPKDVSVFSPEYLSAIILVAGITAACVFMLKKQKIWLSVWGYYLITLVPVLGIIQVGGQAMADRYTYLPSIGPFLVMGLTVGSGAAWGPIRMKALQRRALAAVAVLIFCSLALLTYKQTGVWKNNMELWNYVIEKDPEKVPLAYKNRGTAFDRNGRLIEAIEDYDKAIDLGLKDAQIFNNRGLVYLKLGRVDLAVSDFRSACELGDSFGCNAPQYLFKK